MIASTLARSPRYAGAVTRIIAGQWGGRRLQVPAKGTRPTTDRVREALFSRLDHSGVLTGAKVLDLFAGSGALGFEALSRGASEVTLVESGAPAVRVLQTNVRELGAGGQARVVREKVAPFVARSAATTPGFTLVLIDPPYDLNPDEVDAFLEGLPALLAPQATVVLEGSTRARAPQWPAALEVLTSKDYGETRLFYAEHVQA